MKVKVKKVDFDKRGKIRQTNYSNIKYQFITIHALCYTGSEFLWRVRGFQNANAVIDSLPRNNDWTIHVTPENGRTLKFTISEGQTFYSSIEDTKEWNESTLKERYAEIANEFDKNNIRTQYYIRAYFEKVKGGV